MQINKVLCQVETLHVAAVRTIIGIIKYSNFTDIEGTILMLDFEGAFDRVQHDYLFEGLKYFNLGDEFIQWSKTFYNSRSNITPYRIH